MCLKGPYTTGELCEFAGVTARRTHGYGAAGRWLSTPTIGPPCDKLSRMKKWADEMVLGRSNVDTPFVNARLVLEIDPHVDLAPCGLNATSARDDR